MIDFSYMELIPASLIFRFALFSINLTCVREIGRFAAKKGSLRSPRGRLVASLPFDQNKFSQNIIKRLQQSWK